MKILVFLTWVALGVIYFFIWGAYENCCTNSTSSQEESSLQSIPPLPSSGDGANFDSGVAADALSSSAKIQVGNGCIYFTWGNSDPLTNTCFEHWRDSLINEVKPGQVLELIGGYFEKENKIMATGDLGLIRASKVKALFSGKMAVEDIKIRSKNWGDTTHVIGTLDDAVTSRAIYMNDHVKELDDKALIYFKFASNAGISDNLVDQYTTNLAGKLKSNADQLIITGHTDDDASAEHNMKLGLMRAQIIKDLLVSKGVKSSRIKVKSKGEEQPIAPNDTEENRKLNRRVEIEVIHAAQSNLK
ncbi:MAG: OmpA family protein [Saprospiraceae bacterium]